MEVLDVVKDDRDDNRIIEGAAALSEAVVIGDKDLRRLRSDEGIRIMRVTDFLKRRQEIE